MKAKISQQPEPDANANSVQFHRHDLELNSIYREYCEGIDETNIIDKDGKDKSFYKNHIKESFTLLCKTLGKDFDDFTTKLIEIDNAFYFPTLEWSLYFKDEDEIEFFLEHQINKNPSNASTTIDLLQSIIRRNLKLNSPFDNSVRTKIIKKFVDSFRAKEKRRTQKQKKKVSKNQDKPIRIPKVREYSYPVLSYEKENQKHCLTVLHNLSAQLFDQKCTREKSSFENVFTKHEPCEWLKDDIAFLSMLLKQLKKQKYISIIGSQKNTGIFKVSRQYFRLANGQAFGDRTLINSRNKLKKRNPSLYEKLEKRVMALLPKPDPDNN